MQFFKDLSRSSVSAGASTDLSARNTRMPRAAQSRSNIEMPPIPGEKESRIDILYKATLEGDIFIQLGALLQRLGKYVIV